MRRLLTILLLLPFLAACQDEKMPAPTGKGELVVGELNRQQGEEAVVTRAVDADLAVSILDAEGHVYDGHQYAAGASVPSKFILPVGDYALYAHTENLATWQTDNGGLGSAVYESTTPFAIEADWVTYLDVKVPMQNYGVLYSVPENFSQWFPTADFTVSAGSRSCTPTTAQTAYFAPADGAFTFSLHLVNTDGEEYTTTAHTFTRPKAGTIYHVHYTFGADDDPSHLRVAISYDDTFEELEVEVVVEE